jgi:hypothetical protein
MPVSVFALFPRTAVCCAKVCLLLLFHLLFNNIANGSSQVFQMDEVILSFFLLILVRCLTLLTVLFGLSLISERYPLCSQLITENRIPEFGMCTDRVVY